MAKAGEVLSLQTAKGSQPYRRRCRVHTSALQSSPVPSVVQCVCTVSEVSLIILLDFNGVHRLFGINEAKVLNQEAI